MAWKWIKASNLNESSMQKTSMFHPISIHSVYMVYLTIKQSVSEELVPLVTKYISKLAIYQGDWQTFSKLSDNQPLITKYVSKK